MINVRQLLARKGHAVRHVGPDETLYAALQQMAQHDVGALVVLDGERLAGIFSERDYARQVILKGKASKDTPVRDVMTSRVLFARLEQTLEECMALMTDKHIRHLPVLAEGRVEGILSIGDVVKAVISEKEFIISQLETYITSG
jgi:CBS domain-containing protein